MSHFSRLRVPRSCSPGYRGPCARAAAPGRAGVHAGRSSSAARRPVWPPKLDEPAPGEVEVLPVRGHVSVIMGAGGNVTVQTGEQGILLVDTGIASMSEKVWAAVQTIAPPRKPLRYVINTTENPEHTGGNAVIAAKGETVPLREANYTAGPQGIHQLQAGLRRLAPERAQPDVRAYRGKISDASGGVAGQHLLDRSEAVLLQRRAGRHDELSGEYRWQHHRLLPEV